MSFPGGSAGKESTFSVEDLGSVSGLGRSPGDGNGYPLQYSSLENSMDCVIHWVTQSQTRLSDHSGAGNAREPGSVPELGRSAGEGIGYPLQYSWASLVAHLVKNLPAMQETWFSPWVGKIPWRREWLSAPRLWPGEFHRLYSPWGHKESDTTERLSLSLSYSVLYIYLYKYKNVENIPIE